MSKLKIAKQIPLTVLVKRIVKKAVPNKKINYSAVEYRTSSSSHLIRNMLNDALPATTINKVFIHHYLNHEFNLLGSGWISRNFGANNQVHPSHQEHTDSIIGLIDPYYQLINWQKDVKTNHEYDILRPFYQQTSPKGVDVKDLWELGRLQHLPQLALAARNGFEVETLRQEFRNTCLDFISANPIGMGIQWACTMDVGIRVCNFLLAYDLFQGDFDEPFKQIFTDSVYQHGQFILQHLEHKEGAAGNHYLFNLIGLLFVGNYLQVGKLTNFACQELEKETLKQFFKDGGNFEGSTAYHCLSAEVVLYASALMLRKGALSDIYLNRIRDIARLVKDMQKPNGEIPQFGDNDSGRLFKLTNEDDNLLNYKTLLNAFSGIFPELDQPASIHQTIVYQLSNYNKLDQKKPPESPYETRQLSLSGRSFHQESIIKYGSTIDLKRIQYHAYPEFGLYIYSSDQFYLAVCAISNEKMHHSWGHVHNDKLSFDLQVNGVDLVKDVGTYIYTSDPVARNEFRSVKAHHGIVVEGIEQNKLIAPFYMERESVCKLLSSSAHEIIIQVIYYGVVHERRFVIEEEQLVITDYCNKAFEVNINKFPNYSPNYGIRL